MYHASVSPPYASSSVYDGGGIGSFGVRGIGGGGDDDDEGMEDDVDDEIDDDDDAYGTGGFIRLDTFYRPTVAVAAAVAESPVDAPDSCRQRVIQTHHRSSI